MPNDQDTNGNGGSATVANASGRLIWLTAILLVVAAVLMFWLQERSVVRTCMDLASMVSKSYDICFTGMNEKSAVAFDDQFKSGLGKVLAKNSSNNGIIHGLIAALVGGVAALLCVVALPADQLQFTGNLEKAGGKLRVGGAVGIFLLFAFAGGWLAWSNTPGNNQKTLQDQAMEAMLITQKKLNAQIAGLEKRLAASNDRHNALIDNLADNTDDFALSILNRGYFSQMNGQFEIDCENPQTERQKQFLKVDVPGLRSRSAELEYGVFEIPLGNLLKPQQAHLQPDPENPDGNESIANMVSELQIDLKHAEQRYITPILAQTNFRIFKTRNSPTSREVRMRTKIVARNVAEYCNSDSLDSGPLARSEEFDHLAGRGR